MSAIAAQTLEPANNEAWAADRFATLLASQARRVDRLLAVCPGRDAAAGAWRAAPRFLVAERGFRVLVEQGGVLCFF